MKNLITFIILILSFNLQAKTDDIVKMNSNTKYTVFLECFGKTLRPSIVNNGTTIDLVFHINNNTYLTGFSRGVEPTYKDKFNPELRYFTKVEIQNAARKVCLASKL
jgi:hypothetical protein